jgi:hypothetical protein
MRIKDNNTQIREKINELKKAQEYIDLKKSYNKKKLDKLNNSFFVNTDKLRTANWEYDNEKLVLQLLDEYQLIICDKIK